MTVVQGTDDFKVVGGLSNVSGKTSILRDIEGFSVESKAVNEVGNVQGNAILQNNKVTALQAYQQQIANGNQILAQASGEEDLANSIPVGQASSTDVISSAKGTGEGGSNSSSHAVEVSISRSNYPEIADHWSEAQENGHPDTLTIDRPGATIRRNESLRNVPTVKGKDRDEYPPAMFAEGGKGASVKHTDPYQNRAAGAKVMQQLRPHPDGTKIKITITD